MDYATQSRFSDPGRHADWLDATPADLAALRDVASGLVFHHWAHGDPTGHGFAPERFPEIDLRYAEAMLGRLRELNPAPLGVERVPTERILGCCRDFTLLYVTMLRHHGIPARTRVGFGNYLMPGWHVDHVVAEVWDGHRWRLVEPGFPADNQLDVDVLDVPRDRFLVGADAWRAHRDGRLDPAKAVVSPDLADPYTRGRPYLRHNLVLDLAALNKHEMVLWDFWGPRGLDPVVTEAEAARADELAAVDPNDLAAVRRAFEAADVRVPPVIRSRNPLTGVTAEVRLAAGVH
jgi:hypothetical protein